MVQVTALTGPGSTTVRLGGLKALISVTETGACALVLSFSCDSADIAKPADSGSPNALPATLSVRRDFL